MFQRIERFIGEKIAASIVPGLEPVKSIKKSAPDFKKKRKKKSFGGNKNKNAKSQKKNAGGHKTATIRNIFAAVCAI